MTRTQLYRSYLSSADLTSAKLEGAHLGGTNFTRACLDKAVLINTSFHRAYLGYASLAQANLSGSKIDGTDFTGVALEAALSIDGARLSLNLGLSSSSISYIWEHGGSLIDRDAISSSREWNLAYERARQISEIRAEWGQRVLDVEESLKVYEDGVESLRSAAQESLDIEWIGVVQKGLLDELVGKFNGDGERFGEEVGELRERIEEVDGKTSEEMEEWMKNQYPEYLDEAHDAVEQLTRHTKLIYEVWKSLSISEAR